jgi:pilus assembly protein CpaE
MSMLAAKKRDRLDGLGTVIPIGRAQFVATVCDDSIRDVVNSVAKDLGHASVQFIEGGAEALLTAIKTSSHIPSLIVIDISDAIDPLVTMEAITEHMAGRTTIVAVGMVNDVALYRRLIEMGVADYLVKPVYGPTLAGALQSAVRVVNEREQPQAAKSGRLVALIGARGGSGATTLAVSTAWSLAHEKRMNVVLVDLDLHFGSMALSLDLEPSLGFREILTNPDRIDSVLIRGSMSNVNDRLRVLASEEPLDDTIDVGPEGLEALIVNLSGGSDCVIVDLPRSLDALSRHVLARADIVGIVTEQSLPAMRDTQRLLGLFKTMRAGAKTVVIANRMGGVSGEVGRVDFERGIGAKIDFAIPFDTKTAVAAAERAKAFAEVARDAKTATALRELANELSGVVRPAKSSFLKRMLGK